MTEAEWLARPRPFKMLDALSKQHRAPRTRAGRRKLRLFACAGCRAVWSLLTDRRRRHAIEVAERYADGLAGARELQAAREAAMAVKSIRGFPSRRRFAAWAAAMAIQERPFQAAHGVASYLAQPAFGSGYHITGVPAHADLIRDIFGNPFRPVKVERSWLTWNGGAVVRLAQAIYDKRRFDRLPARAATLEKAGCTDREVLSHCRARGPHVNGCWVVDALTGKS